MGIVRKEAKNREPEKTETENSSNLPLFRLSLESRARILSFAKLYKPELTKLTLDSLRLANREPSDHADQEMELLDKQIYEQLIQMTARAVEVVLSPQELNMIACNCAGLDYVEVADYVINYLNESRDENKFIKCDFDGTTYIVPTWEQMADVTAEVAKQIIASGIKYDVIIALAKGGLTWARLLADCLVNSMPDITIASITTIAYKKNSIALQAENVEIAHPISGKLTGKRVLIFDEVSDSGRTLIVAKKFASTLDPESIETAVLCHKPHSITETDYSGFSTSHWVVFAHEDLETAITVIESWSSHGLSAEVIRHRLEEMDLPLKRLQFFLDQIT